MDFRLLGAVEAWSKHQRIDLGPPKQRLLFAVLALNINQLVSVDRLVDLTWPQSPPPTAQHAIHVRISKLRATLAAQNGDARGIQILTRGSAYALSADPMCVDTHRFRALVAKARATADDVAKVPLYRRALELWQGPPLADVAATADTLGRLCAGIEETRLVALEECLEAELRLGRHRTVVDELAELVAQHPYLQRLLAQLMLARHRAGRAPEALRAYRLARTRMVEELGLEPEPRLQRLELAILQADPALEVTTDKPAESIELIEPGAPTPLADADGALAVEVDKLSKRFGQLVAVDQVSFGVRPGEIVGVFGPPGAGKTTILRLLSTVLAPSDGMFSIAGIPSSRPVEIRRIIGVVPAGIGRPRHMTGQEFLTYHARLFGAGRLDAARQASRLLAEVGLAEQARARVTSYSRDMRQRLELARALVNEPAVVLLDEPATGLDEGERHGMLEIVRRVATERGVTVLLGSRMRTGMEQICGSVLLLTAGAAVASGPVGELPPGPALVAASGRAAG